MASYLTQAPKDMFRVLATEDGQELLLGDFAGFREACLVAARRMDSPTDCVRVYDDDGREVGRLGR